MQYLIVLDISNNNLKSIHFTLPFISLKQLNLRNNKIETIGNELKFPDTLVFLDIGYNKLQYQQLQQMISQLQNNKMMLRIDHNSIHQEDEQKLYYQCSNTNIVLSLDENDEVGSQFLVSINDTNSEINESQNRECQPASISKEIHVTNIEEQMHQIENQVQQNILQKQQNNIQPSQKQDLNINIQKNDVYKQEKLSINKYDQFIDPVITKTYEELLKIYEKQNILVNFPNPTSKTYSFLSNIKRNLFQALYDVKEKDRQIKRLNAQIKEQQDIIKQKNDEVKNEQVLLRQLTQDYEQQTQLINQLNIELNNKNQQLSSYKSSFNEVAEFMKDFKTPCINLSDLHLANQTLKHLEIKFKRLDGYIQAQNKQIVSYRQEKQNKSQSIQISRYTQTEYQFSYQNVNIQHKLIQAFDDIHLKNTAIQTDEICQNFNLEKDKFDYYINKYQGQKSSQQLQNNQISQQELQHKQVDIQSNQPITKKQTVDQSQYKHTKNNQLDNLPQQQSTLNKSRVLYEQLQNTKIQDVKFNDIDLQVTKCSDLSSDEMMRLSYYDITKELNKLDLGEAKKEYQQHQQHQPESMSLLIEKYQNSSKLFHFDDSDYTRYLRFQ